MPRYFTRESAEGLLPQIEPLLLDIQSLRAGHAVSAQQSTDLRELVKSNGHIKHQDAGDTRDALGSANERLEAWLQQITALGVLVKDLDSGLIDFPWLRDGHEVYLCWKLGEGERISWWHEIEDGFTGRQPLDPTL